MAKIPALALHPGLLAAMLKHLLKAKANLPVAAFVLHLLTSRAVVTAERRQHRCDQAY